MLLILIVVCIFGAVSTFVLALAARPHMPSMQARMQEFRTRSAMAFPGEVDLEAPFFERVLRPSIEGIARTAASILPNSMLKEIENQLAMAGNPMHLNAYVIFWLSSLGLFGGVGMLLFVGMPGGAPQKLLVAAVFFIIGWMAPRSWLKGKVKTKQKLVLKALPDALDLVTTCVEAGLGLDAALAKVAEKSEGPLAEELSHMLRDVAMGKLRREALTEMAERVGVEELTNFVNSIIQAEQLGVAIAQVLRVQSDQMRTRRRQRAEQSAHEAPIKMLFPLVLFIFPAFMIVILGPAGIRLADTLVNR